MWADTIDLVLGRWLVGVRPDSEAIKRQLERLLALYLAPPGARARTNYSVRAAGRWWKRADVEFYEAGLRTMTDRSFDKIAHRLVAELSGIAADGPLSAGQTRVTARVVARGERCVLVFANTPERLDASGDAIVEVPMWHPVVDSEQRAVLVPPLLEHVDWSAAKLDRPAGRPERLTLAGLVAPPDRSGAAALTQVWRGGSGALDEWGLLLATLEQEERVITVPTDELGAVPGAVVRLLA